MIGEALARRSGDGVMEGVIARGAWSLPPETAARNTACEICFVAMVDYCIDF